MKHSTIPSIVKRGSDLYVCFIVRVIVFCTAQMATKGNFNEFNKHLFNSERALNCKRGFFLNFYKRSTIGIVNNYQQMNMNIKKK